MVFLTLIMKLWAVDQNMLSPNPIRRHTHITQYRLKVFRLWLTPTCCNRKPMRRLNMIRSILKRTNVKWRASTYGKPRVILINSNPYIGRSTGVGTGAGQWCSIARRGLPRSQMTRRATVCWVKEKIASLSRPVSPSFYLEIYLEM